MKKVWQILFGFILAVLLLSASINRFGQISRLLVLVVVFLLLMRLLRYRGVLVTYGRVPLITASAVLLALVVVSALFHVCIPFSKTQAIGLEDYYIYYLKDFGPTWPKSLPTWRYAIAPAFSAQWAGLPFKNYAIQTGGMTSNGTWTERVIVFPLPSLLIVILPTLAVWWCQPTFLQGKCTRCNYDLKGNVSSVCPECGRKIEPETGQMEVAERVMHEDGEVLRKLGQ